jgi:hypothetical protein
MPRFRKFFDHTCGEIHELSRIQTFLFMMVSAAWSIRRLRAATGGAARNLPLLAGWPFEELASLGLATLAALAACAPRTRVRATRRPQQRLADLSAIVFRSRYRFRREHVQKMLGALDLLDQQGRPVLLRVGKTRAQLLWADTALMIVLRRLATASRWDDLIEEMGCSRTLLSAGFIYLIDYIYAGFAARLNDIRTWQADFPAFAAHTRARGSLFDNTIGFVDGHFQPVCRPGGPTNVGHSVSQADLYSGYYKQHGLKYICIVLPNGILLAEGAWKGKEHDNTMLIASQVSSHRHCHDLCDCAVF